MTNTTVSYLKRRGKWLYRWISYKRPE